MQDIGERPDILLKIVEFLYAVASGCCKSSPELGVGDQTLKCSRESLLRGWRNEQTVQPVANQLRDASHESADARDSHGHGFHQRYGQSFGEACKNKKVSARQFLPGRFVTEGAFKDHGSLKCLPGNERLHLVPLGPVADKAQTQVISAAQKIRKDTKKDQMPFSRNQTPDADNLNWFIPASRRNG